MSRVQKFRQQNQEAGLCRCGRHKPERGRKTCSQCLEDHREHNRARARNNRMAGLCSCGGKLRKGFASCEECREASRQNSQTLRVRVLTKLGLECACCGETYLGFLEVDHVRNDGAKDRKTRSPRSLFLEILRPDFDTSHFQTLCANCNSRKHKSGLGYCDHPQHNGLAGR